MGDAAAGRVGRVAVGELGDPAHRELVDGGGGHEALQERGEALAVGAAARGAHEEAEPPRPRCRPCGGSSAAMSRPWYRRAGMPAMVDDA